ncbi:MAG: SAM-dependent methyltransferase [Acidimicrobiia bacterium]|nr:SAM-dependent methyltransferase [Acidimicrobiia bacterium]
MFALTDADLQGRILGCADGPASFNAEATRRGATVVSFDPLYRFAADQIRDRINVACDSVLEQARQHQEQFVWDFIPSVEALGQIRMAAMNAFLADYPRGSRDGRYVDAELPALPFADRAFDLALCSHFLFLYSEQLGETFHEAAIAELCRVAGEVRIFPLQALDWARSPYVESAVERLRRAGLEVSIERVPYEFVRGANEMMRVLSPARSA